MRPQRPQQRSQGAGIGILLLAFVVLVLTLAVLLPLLSSHEGTAIEHLGTPIVALATARAAALATATPSPTPSPTASSSPTPSATAPVPSSTPTAAPTATPLPPLPTATRAAVADPPTATADPTPGSSAPLTETMTPVAGAPLTPTTETTLPTATAPPPADVSPTTGPSLAALTDPHFLAMLAARVIALTNHERTTRGLPPLAPDPVLSRIAVQRSEDMIQRGYFSHYDPATHQAAVVELLNRMVIPYHEVGENIVDNRNEPLDDSTPAQVVAAWMNSKEHRTNILDPAYTNIGVGIGVAQEDGALRVVFAQVFLD